MAPPIIIIGAGLAGWTTVRELRKRDADAPVMLVTADSGDFYAKPSLSNALAQGRAPAQLVSTPAARMTQTLNVTLLAHTRVLAIDPAARTVATTRGEFAYSQLVLATGAQPIRLPLAGDAADQVRAINSLEDFSAFHAGLTRPPSGARPAKQVLIMGAGLIGCEFANDLAAAGHGVTVVDPAASPIAALLPAAAGQQLREALAALGVTWHFGTTVQAVDVGTDPLGPALRATLSNGQAVPVDQVLSAIGLRADTALARAAGLACERGILVDASLQTSQAHIFALGDSAQYATGSWGENAAADLPAPTGGRTLPYVMPIMHAARALASTLAGTRTPAVFPLMPVLIKTPALPVVVASPAPGAAGEWHGPEPGVWQYIDPQGQRRGFVLTGAQTARRAEQAQQMRS